MMVQSETWSRRGCLLKNGRVSGFRMIYYLGCQVIYQVRYCKVRYLSIISLCAECRHPTHLTLGTLPVLNATYGMGTSPGTLVFCTCLECFSCYLPAVLS